MVPETMLSSHSPSITWDDLDTQHTDSLACPMLYSLPLHQIGRIQRTSLQPTKILLLQAKLTGLLKCVNAVWHEISGDTYGDTYHTATPAIWFQLNLSLNLSIAIATHLTNARNKLSKTQRQRQTTTYTDLHTLSQHVTTMTDTGRLQTNLD